MAKIDDIFKKNLSDFPIEKLDLDMSWKDFSQKNKKNSLNGLKILASITVLILTSITSVYFLCYENQENQFEQNCKLYSTDTILKKECHKEIQSEPKKNKAVNTNNIEKTPGKIFKKKRSNIEQLNTENAIQKLPDNNIKVETIQSEKIALTNNPTQIDSLKTKEEQKKPVIIVKNKTVAIQKTDTLINFEEKKRKR